MSKKVKAPKLSEAFVLKGLSHRHGKDAFFCKVKTGPPWGMVGAGLRIIDAIAIKKSYVNELVTAYEVKVSKADFNSDEKWVEYLPFCHRFYFAVPAHLVSKAEVAHADAGLVWVYETGATRVLKPAPRRKVVLPESMFMYLVFSVLDSDRHPFYSSKREYLEAWVQDKGKRKELGWQVATKMARRLGHLESYLEIAEARVRGTDRANVTEVLRDFGIFGKAQLRQRLTDGVSKAHMSALRMARSQLDSVIRCMDPNSDPEKT